MDIVYSSDGNYARHVAASIVSLLENNRQEPHICIWILNVGLQEEHLQNLTAVTQQYGREIRIVDLSDIRQRLPQKELSLGNAFTIETYSRLFIADVLPDTVHRAMYIDGDTSIMDNIHDMYYCDFNGCYAAAVVDQPNFGLDVSRKDAELSGGPYFAFGMFLLDLDAWRRDQILPQLFDYFINREGGLTFPDQSMMNHVMNGKILKLPFRYHVITPAFFLSYRQMCQKWGEPFYSKEEFVNGKRHPAIVHYAVFRPWKKWCLHPTRRYYRQCLKKTPYKDVPLEGDSLFLLIKKIFNAVLVRLHIRH